MPASATLGIGPSVAINAIQHSTLAEIGSALIVGANNVNVTVNGTYTTNTHADAGAESDGALPAAVALTATLNDTTARIKPGATMSTIAGNLTVTANHTANATTVADAKAGGAGSASVSRLPRVARWVVRTPMPAPT